jgi:hypothetical protein
MRWYSSAVSPWAATSAELIFARLVDLRGFGFAVGALLRARAGRFMALLTIGLDQAPFWLARDLRRAP